MVRLFDLKYNGHRSNSHSDHQVVLFLLVCVVLQMICFDSGTEVPLNSIPVTHTASGRQADITVITESQKHKPSAANRCSYKTFLWRWLRASTYISKQLPSHHWQELIIFCVSDPRKTNPVFSLWLILAIVSVGVGVPAE